VRARRVRSFATTGLFLLACLYTLSLARPFLIPLAVGMMVYFLLRPPVRLLKRMGIGEAWGAALVLAGLCVVVGLGLYALSWPAATWVSRAPSSLRAVQARLAPITTRLQRLSRTAAEVDKLAAVGTAPSTPEVRLKEPGFGAAFVGGMQSFLGNGLLVLSLVYFLLAEGDVFLRKLVLVLPRLKERDRAVDIAREMEVQISQYIVWTTFINAGLGLATALALWGLGMPNPGLWGFLAFLTNFIPYVGGVVCTALIGLAALVAFPDVWWALLVPLVFLVLNTLESYFITPAIMGRRFTLDTPVLFVGLLFWWYVWGLTGALLAVPMMAAFRIVCERVDGLQAVAAFLAEPPRRAVERTGATSADRA
jgi:predicted PurR-regulated permease PerM